MSLPNCAGFFLEEEVARDTDCSLTRCFCTQKPFRHQQEDQGEPFLLGPGAASLFTKITLFVLGSFL